MGLPAVPYPRYLITLIGSNSGAGDGEPGAAVRDTTTGRVIDRAVRAQKTCERDHRGPATETYERQV